MQTELKLIYAHDPLCGWCYGLIPALRHFEKVFPYVEIEVLPGGLFVGTPPRPYASLITHIKTAEVHLQRVTGRKPSDAFHALISQTKHLDAASERPTHAILQVAALAPTRTIEFAHRLQELHYEDGADLNSAEVYHELTKEMDLPDLDVDAILSATLKDPIIANAYSRCARLTPSGYPTVFVIMNDEVIGRIPSTYDPQHFIQEFVQIAGDKTPETVQKA